MFSQKTMDHGSWFQIEELAMRIGDLAEQSGVSRDTVRFYERNGLITSAPGQSATNNYREYPDENLARLAFFTKARAAGMSVADMRDIIDSMDGRCDPAVGREVVASKIAELETRAAKIQKVVAFLKGRLGTEGPSGTRPS